MNEITLTKKEQLLRDGYKLIYPNNLGLSINMHSKKEKYKTIYKKGLDIEALGMIEAFKNKNKLFLAFNIHGIIRRLKNGCEGLLELVFQEKNETATTGVQIISIELFDEKGEIFSDKRWTKRIKEIYLNSEASSLAIVIDESFQWPKERMESLAKENQKKKKETLESKVDLLLK